MGGFSTEKEGISIDTKTQNQKKTLKIVTWNVNGLKSVVSRYQNIDNLLAFLDADIVCFQEIKLRTKEVTGALCNAKGYQSYFACNRSKSRATVYYTHTHTHIHTYT